MSQTTSEFFSQHIRAVEDFPKTGIRFYDIAPLIGNGAVFAQLIDTLTEPYDDATKPSKVVSFDARGFLFGSAMAYKLGIGHVMLRKAGKLPGATTKQHYGLEYGSDVLEIQNGVLTAEDTVVLIDDVIATGGTALAGVELVKQQGSDILEFCTVIDLPELGGSEHIAAAGVAVRSVLEMRANT